MRAQRRSSLGRFHISRQERGRHGYRPLDADLSGRVALITGANRGMGKETARELTRMGAEVILGCRSHERGVAARSDIIQTTGRAGVTVMDIDLSSLASVRAFAAAFGERFPKLDVLVNNAAASLRVRQATAEGFERQWATNVLGPHLLTELLLPALIASGRGRIVDVSTRAAGGLDLTDTQYDRRPYSGTAAYRASKQASRMLSWALADRLRGESVTVNALNPGYVLTELTTNVGGSVKIAVAFTRRWAESARDGADTAIWLAASPEVDGVTAKFWNKRREIPCRFRRAEQIAELTELVERQLANTPTNGEPLRTERRGVGSRGAA